MSKIEKIEKYIKAGKVDKLVSLSRNDDKSVRLAAIAGLGKLIEHEASLNALVSMTEDEDADIREAVVTAFGESDSSYVETKLTYCISNEKETKVLEAAKRSLAKVREAKRK